MIVNTCKDPSFDGQWPMLCILWWVMFQPHVAGWSDCSDFLGLVKRNVHRVHHPSCDEIHTKNRSFCRCCEIPAPMWSPPRSRWFLHWLLLTSDAKDLEQRRLRSNVVTYNAAIAACERAPADPSSGLAKMDDMAGIESIEINDFLGIHPF